MGTTLVALALVDDGRLAVINIGDSRLYVLHEGELRQVTSDHNLVAELVAEGRLSKEEAEFHPRRNVITRALGVDPEVPVDLFLLDPVAGDRFLLCSDGLFRELSDDQIALAAAPPGRPRGSGPRSWSAEAKFRGGNDNITVIVVDVVDPDRRRLGERPGTRYGCRYPPTTSRPTTAGRNRRAGDRRPAPTRLRRQPAPGLPGRPHGPAGGLSPSGWWSFFLVLLALLGAGRGGDRLVRPVVVFRGPARQPHHHLPGPARRGPVVPAHRRRRHQRHHGRRRVPSPARPGGRPAGAVLDAARQFVDSMVAEKQSAAARGRGPPTPHYHPARQPRSTTPSTT